MHTASTRPFVAVRVPGRHTGDFRGLSATMCSTQSRAAQARPCLVSGRRSEFASSLLRVPL